MSDTKPKAALALLLSLEKNCINDPQIRLRVVKVDPMEQYGFSYHIERYTDGDEADLLRAFEIDLTIYSDFEGCWSMGFNGVNLTLVSQAEGYLKLLKKIEANNQKLKKQFGEADTFGKWVARVCFALGIEAVHIPYNSSWAGKGYSCYTPGEAAGYIDNFARDLKDGEKRASFLRGEGSLVPTR